MKRKHNQEQNKVCPSCGCEPWDFAGEFEDNPKNRKHRIQPKFCSECGDKLIPRCELPKDIWKDPYVKQALKEGRESWDIAVYSCPKCGHYGYYNEGSHFSCRFCNVTFQMEGDEEIVSLSDTVTDTTDGYNNETQARTI